MSKFGDSRWYMNDLYDNIEDFFKNGGTLKQLFEVLEWYFEWKDSNSNE